MAKLLLEASFFDSDINTSIFVRQIITKQVGQMIIVQKIYINIGGL
jgi:hypothetical protein